MRILLGSLRVLPDERQESIGGSADRAKHFPYPAPMAYL